MFAPGRSDMNVLLTIVLVILAAPLILYASPVIIYVLPFIVVGLGLSLFADYVRYKERTRQR